MHACGHDFHASWVVGAALALSKQNLGNTVKFIFQPAEEIAQGEQDTINANARKDAEETANQEKADLKASAKQKLINGEPLTEEEADTIVL